MLKFIQFNGRDCMKVFIMEDDMKKILTFLLLITMSISLIGCGKFAIPGTADSDKEVLTADPKSTLEDHAQVLPEDDVEEIDEEDAEVDEDEIEVETTAESYPIDKIRSKVSENRLWVEYQGPEGREIALIDTDGNIILSDPNIIQFGDVHNNSAFYVKNTDTSSTTVIIDADGNELKRFDFVDEDRFYLVKDDYYGYIFYEYTSGFAGNQHILHIVNPKGEIVCSRDMTPDIDRENGEKLSECTDMYIGPQNTFIFTIGKVGENVYAFCPMPNYFESLNDIFLLQMKDSSIVYTMLHKTDEWGNVINGDYCFDGSGYVFYVDNKSFGNLPSFSYTTLKTYSSDEEFSADWAALETSEKIEESFVSTNGFAVEGYPNFNGSIYDLANSKWVTKAEFPDSVRIDVVSAEDGYIVYILTGADGNKYYVVGDTEGNLLYDPIQGNIDINIYFNDYFENNTAHMDNGNLVFVDGVVLTNGEKVSFDELPADFKFTHDHAFKRDGIICVSISDGYIVNYDENSSYGNKFKKLGTSDYITTVK